MTESIRLTRPVKILKQYLSLFPIISRKRKQIFQSRSAYLLPNMVCSQKVKFMSCLVKVDFQEIQCIYYILWFSDRSPLLLCRKSTITDIRNMRITLRSDDAVSSAPQCISARNLQIFRGKRFEYEGKACNVYKGIWKPNKSTNVDVAIKFLKTPNDEKKMKV